jgi:hypothetical protein
MFFVIWGKNNDFNAQKNAHQRAFDKNVIFLCA